MFARCPPGRAGCSRFLTPSSSSRRWSRPLLTLWDLERLFGVSRARGGDADADRSGAGRSTLTLSRVDLLRLLRLYRKRGAFRAWEQRRARLVTELCKARLTGICCWQNLQQSLSMF